MSIKDFIRLTKLEDCRISPDGSYVLFETRDPNFEHDDYNHTLWLADTRGEKVRPLTHSGKDTSASWAPNSKRVAFISERDGSKELYVIDVDGGEAEKITHAGAVGPLSWSTDGRRIAYSHTVPVAEKPADVPEASWQRRPYVISDRTYKIDGTGISVRAHPQIMVVDLQDKTTCQVTSGTIDSLEAAFSPDGTSLAIIRSRSGRMETHLTDVWLAAADGTGSHQVTSTIFNPRSLSWSPDGKSLAFYGSDRTDSILQMWIIDATTCELRLLVDGEAHEVASFAGYSTPPPAWLSDGTRIYFGAAKQAKAFLASVDVASGVVHEEISADGASVLLPTLAAETGRVAYVVTGWQEVASVQVSDLAGQDRRTLHSLENSTVDFFKPRVEERVFTIGSETRQGWVICRDGDAHVPLLVDVHGGPYSCHGNTFPRFALWYELVSRGWAVLLLNPVGSSTFGREFAGRLRGGWGEKDLPEQLAAVDQLVAEGLADPERLAIYGYSYGGFVVSHALGTTDRFKAAVVGAPITDFVSYFAMGDNAARFLDSDIALPYQDTSRYMEHSPVSRAHLAKTPTLIVQGLSDDRCPPGQSEELYARLTEAGVTCQMLLYPDASHKFTTEGPPSQRLDVEQRMVDWLIDHVSPE